MLPVGSLDPHRGVTYGAGPHAIERRSKPRYDDVFHPVVDRLLHLERDDRRAMFDEIRAALQAFPAVATSETRMLRGIAFHDALNRIVFRVQRRFPGLASRAARFVPVRDPGAELAKIPSDRPVILALTHFGPIHFIFTVLQHRFPGRTVYGVHAGGDDAETTAAYLRKIGVTPLVSNEQAIRTVARAMETDPTCVVVLSYDYLGSGGRHAVPFLGRSVTVARGLAYLADLGRAVVVPAWGEWSVRGLRVVVGNVRELDRTRGARERQNALTDSLFAELEARVRRFPSVWTEWRNCRPGEGAR